MEIREKIAKKECDVCVRFYECDNMDMYDVCLQNDKKNFRPKLIDEIDLKTSDCLEMVCGLAECADSLSQNDIDALLSRNDVDTDYSDMYFFPMLPYRTIREAIKYSSNEKKE